MLGPHASGPSSSPTIQLLPPSGPPPQTRNHNCPCIAEGRSAAVAERGLPPQRGRAPSKLGRLTSRCGDERRLRERTSSPRCPPSVAMKSGLCPRPWSSSGGNSGQSSSGVVSEVARNDRQRQSAKLASASPGPGPSGSTPTKCFRVLSCNSSRRGACTAQMANAKRLTDRRPVVHGSRPPKTCLGSRRSSSWNRLSRAISQNLDGEQNVLVR